MGLTCCSTRGPEQSKANKIEENKENEQLFIQLAQQVD